MKHLVKADNLNSLPTVIVTKAKIVQVSRYCNVLASLVGSLSFGWVGWLVARPPLQPPGLVSWSHWSCQPPSSCLTVCVYSSVLCLASNCCNLQMITTFRNIVVCSISQYNAMQCNANAMAKFPTSSENKIQT